MSAGDIAHVHHPTGEWMHLREVAESRLQDPRIKVALAADHEIDRSCDIAYIAGISTDLKTLYVDRHFPLTRFPAGRRSIDVTDELWLHECGEACFIILYGDHYLTAHRLITVAEHDMVVDRRINWRAYTEAFEPYSKVDEHERIQRSPSDLFLRPYEDSGDWLLLQRIKETMT